MGRKFVRITRLVAVAAACLAAADGVIAQGRTGAAPSDTEIAARAEEYLTAAVRVSRFSGSVLLARGGRPLFTRSYGMANNELGVPLTALRVVLLRRREDRAHDQHHVQHQ